MGSDTILKNLFPSSRLLLLESLTEAPIREWLNVEIPKAEMSKPHLTALQCNVPSFGIIGITNTGTRQGAKDLLSHLLESALDLFPKG